MADEDRRKSSAMAVGVCWKSLLRKWNSLDGPIATWVRGNLLLVLTISAVVMGVLLGVIGRLADYDTNTVELISFPGEIFMRMLKMLTIPLIVSSIIAGLSQLDGRMSGRMGAYALVYYMSTTIIATVIGIVVVVMIRPGGSDTKQVEAVDEGKTVRTMDTVLDIIRNMFPENLVQACFEQVKTEYVSTSHVVFPDLDLANGTARNACIEYRNERILQYQPGTNIIAFGLVSGRLGRKALPMIQFFTSMNDIIMQMVILIMWYSPVGILCLIAGNIMDVDDLVMTGRQLGLYMTSVILGLLVHGVLIIPSIYFLITRNNPATFFKGIFQAWITALGTASSAATLPVTFRCLEENIGIDPRVTRFVLPVGAVVNMDGSALYEAVAAIFIAQRNGISLGIGSIITVSLMSTLASIGAASIPSAALVTMLLVLAALGLPTKDISLIFAVDWMLDRLRTSVNVAGDAFGAAVVDHLCQDELAKLDALKVSNMPEGFLEPNDDKVPNYASPLLRPHPQHQIPSILIAPNSATPLLELET